MNGNLIDILEVFIELNQAKKNRICGIFFGNLKDITLCKGVQCSECILRTNRIFISDYPIKIIKIKGMLNEQ